MDLNRSPAVADREELVRRISGSGEELSGVKVSILSASRDQGAIRGGEIAEEWVLRQKRLNVFLHRLSPG
jgi:hypothetical protein